MEPIDFRLPPEILRSVFSHIPNQVLYEKLIKPYASFGGNEVQEIVLELICKDLVIRNTMAEAYDPMTHFFTTKELAHILQFTDYVSGYRFIKTVLAYALKINKPLIRRVALYYNYKPSEHNSECITYYLKTIEEFVFDKDFRDKVQLVVGLVLSGPWPEADNDSMNKLRDRTSGVSGKITKLLVQRRHNTSNYTRTLIDLHNCKKLEHLQLFNDQVGDRELRLLSYLSKVTTLTTMDLSANAITKIDYLPIPPNLKKLVLNTNALTTLKPAAISLRGSTSLAKFEKLTHLELNINQIITLKNIKFPANLKVLKVSYNKISSAEMSLPPKLEELDLSSNLLSDVSSLVLPKSLKILNLNDNRLEEFPRYFFYNLPNLHSLSLGSNGISDLDDLGLLPKCLTSLFLDGNEINYMNISNIFTPNLKYLSMNVTGLMTLENLTFPSSLETLKVGDNSISLISNVNFGQNLKTLELNSNLLTRFIFSESSIKIPPNLEFLNLQANAFQTLDNIDFPENLKKLNISGLTLNLFEPDDIQCLPKSLEVLHVYYLMVDLRDSDDDLDNIELDLTEFKNLKTFHFTSPDIKALKVKKLDTLLDCVVLCDCDSELRDSNLVDSTSELDYYD